MSVAAPATAARVLRQLRRDPRTVALLLIVPCVLVALLKYLFVDEPAVFDRIGGPLLGLFPFIAMFVVTSITHPPSRRLSRHPSATSDWLTAVTYFARPPSKARPLR